MQRTNILVSLIIILVLGSSCDLLNATASDQAVLDQLRDAGSDLSKAHPFDFYLYHSEQTGAEQLCAALAVEGFLAIAQEAAAGDEWLCLVSLIMLPTIDNLAEQQTKFDALVDLYGGQYDGWETMVIP